MTPVALRSTDISARDASSIIAAIGGNPNAPLMSSASLSHGRTGLLSEPTSFHGAGSGRVCAGGDNPIVRCVALLIAITGCPLLSSCSTASPPPTTPTASLSAVEARPLHLPATIDPAVQSCPVTGGRHADSLYAPLGNNLAVGPGPVYPTFVGPSPATAAESFSAAGDGWQFAKVPWFSQPSYGGPVVVRGARIDGPSPMRFQSQPNPVPTLELTSANAVFHPGAGWRGWASGILVQTRGCYALQIDGTGFSTVVVFLALVDVPASPTAHAVSGGCGSTTVYQGSPPAWLVDAAGGGNAPNTLPYFSSSSAMIGGFLFGYPLRAGQPNNPTNKILWAVATARNGSPLHVEGHPEGTTTPAVTYSFPDDSSPGEIYPSIVTVPSPGCWAFTLSWGAQQAQVQLAFAA